LKRLKFFAGMLLSFRCHGDWSCGRVLMD